MALILSCDILKQWLSSIVKQADGLANDFDDLKNILMNKLFMIYLFNDCKILLEITYM